jgi:cytochrome oxidase Cu insertion factor (SCO1/SenC/PrrC family)
MNPARIACALVLVSTIGTQTPGAQQAARTPIDISRLGPQVGQQVPDFTLKDQAGRTWTRRSILGSKGAMLVFIRSADW